MRLLAIFLFQISIAKKEKKFMNHSPAGGHSCHLMKSSAGALKNSIAEKEI